MSQSTNEKEANIILSILKDNKFEFMYFMGDCYINCSNPDYQLNDGSNSNLACTIDMLCDAIKKDPDSIKLRKVEKFKPYLIK